MYVMHYRFSWTIFILDLVLSYTDKTLVFRCVQIVLLLLLSLDLNLSNHNYIVSTKIYDKRDDFNFDIVNFPFLDGDVPQLPSYGVYISKPIRFARASSHVTDFNNRNKSLTAKLLKQGYRYHKLRKAFSKFYLRHFELIEKYHVSLKKNLCNKVFVIQNFM